MEGREREGVVLWYSVLTYLTTSQAKQPPLSPFLLPLAWHDSGARGDGRGRHAAENVVYFYDNAHVDVGRKGEGGREGGKRGRERLFCAVNTLRDGRIESAFQKESVMPLSRGWSLAAHTPC